MSVYVNPHHYTNMKSIFTQQFFREFLCVACVGRGGTKATKLNNEIPPKKNFGKAKGQAGKKKRGSGGNEFLLTKFVPLKAGLSERF